MSFSLKVKEEISKIENLAPCCRHAMTYGMLLFGREFSSGGISIMTEHEIVARTYAELLEKETGVKANFSVSEAGKYTVCVKRKKEIEEVLSAFSTSGNESFTRINRGNLLNESSSESEILNCCNASFFKGAFLSCGTVSDPNKGYHLEFVVPFRTLSLDLMKMLSEYGLKAKHMVRRYVNIIYIKDSESIEDLLNIMGAQTAAFEIMNIKIYKDFRNVSNRRANFDSANLARTAVAAVAQVEQIQKIIDGNRFCELPEDLREFAALRIENPDASLREFGEMFSPPLSRSAVNHRIKKLLAFAKKCEEETQKTPTEG